jgi:hypothetical protein
MKKVRFSQIPYIEISIFSSIIAITLSYFFYQARLGIVNPMTGDVIKTLGVSLLLLNSPLALSLFYRNKSQGEQLPWHQSQASITLLTLLIIIAAGFIIQDNNYYIDYGLSVIGYFFFLFSLYRYISLSTATGKLLRNTIFLCLCFAFSLWATAIIWNTGHTVNGSFYGYYSPFFVESIYLGGAHLDILFFSSLSQMIQTYGIPSSGLDGLPYIPYHFGSFWIFAHLSKLIQINPIYFYQLCFPVIFLALFFYSFLLFIVEARNFYSPAKDSTQSLFGIITFTIFAAAFIKFLPNKVAHALGLMRFDFFISPSHLFSLTLTFLSFCLVIPFWGKFNASKLFTKLDMLFLTLVIPSLLAGIGLTKISSIFIIFGLGTYLFMRLGLFRHYQFIVSYIISIFIVLVVSHYTLPVSQEAFSIKYTSFVSDYVVYPLKLLFLTFNYFWSFLFLVFFMKVNDISDIHSLKHAFINRLTLSIEIVILIGILSFLPGTLLTNLKGDEYYFLDFQKWICVSFLLALFDYSSIKLKPAMIALILFLTPLMYVIYGNGKEKYLAYCSHINHMREVVMNAPSEKQDIVNILLKLHKLPLSQKRNALLFIPQNNLAYWSLADQIGCCSVPFIAPALSGIAMVDGLPPVSCGGRENKILCKVGYEGYQLRTRVVCAQRP